MLQIPDLQTLKININHINDLSVLQKGETSVVDSRPTEDGTSIRRRRLCICGERFTTFERVQFRELVVVKKNGRKSPFDRDKLSKSIYIALKKDQSTPILLKNL